VHPGDVWVNYHLGLALERSSRRDEAIRFYTAARAIRPETAHKLAHSLAARGQGDEAIAVFRDLTRLRPGHVRHLGCLGVALKKKGLSSESLEALEAATVACREKIRLRGDDAFAHVDLGNALRAQSKYDEAIAECRAAIRIRPDYDLAHDALGDLLYEQGKTDEAIHEHRTAVRLDPGRAEFHYSLGISLRAQGRTGEAEEEYRAAIRLKPDLAEAHCNLGIMLRAQGNLQEAVAEYREAIRLKPDLAEAHNSLGTSLANQGKLVEAITEFRAAIRLKPESADTHYNLGTALVTQGSRDETIAELRTAIRLKPGYVEAHYNLGKALEQHGRLDEAITEYSTAIRLKRDFAEAHCNLGLALKKKGEHAEALQMLRKGHELGSRRADWRYPSAAWVTDAERMLALSKRLPAILQGKDRPRDNRDRLTLAQMAYNGKQYVGATTLWAEALEREPKVADDRQAQHRYNAACAAALAAAGEGKDEPPLEEAASVRWRKQAIEWLKSELAVWVKSVEVGPTQARQSVAGILQHWKEDSDLLSIRDPAALAKLPGQERKECRALWAEVDDLLAKARGGTAP
jgi:tetratricopeptide (TPR) repeat protein